MNEWEAAWADYVAALDNYDADWSGPDFVIDIAKAARSLNDAKRRLRGLDAEFCKRIGV